MTSSTIPTDGLVDFHCHLDLYPNHEMAVADCQRLRLRALAVTTTPRAWKRNLDLAGRTEYVRAAIGLHPQLAEAQQEELSIWREYLHETRFVGEVGLDGGPRFYKSMAVQVTLLKQILQACATSGGKVLSVHSSRAARPLLQMIENYLPSTRAIVVLHWFNGSKADLSKALELGCYFSVNHEMLSKTRNQELISNIPLDRLLTETDGPFTSAGGSLSQSAYLLNCLQSLALIHQVDVLDLKSRILSNACRLLGET